MQRASEVSGDIIHLAKKDSDVEIVTERFGEPDAAQHRLPNSIFGDCVVNGLDERTVVHTSLPQRRFDGFAIRHAAGQIRVLDEVSAASSFESGLTVN